MPACRCASTCTARPGTTAPTHLPPVDLLLEAFVPVRTQRAADAAKRAVDVAASLALLLLFAPVMLLALLAVKLTSAGPALFQPGRGSGVAASRSRC